MYSIDDGGGKSKERMFPGPRTAEKAGQNPARTLAKTARRVYNTVFNGEEGF